MMGPDYYGPPDTTEIAFARWRLYGTALVQLALPAETLCDEALAQHVMSYHVSRLSIDASFRTGIYTTR